MKRIHRFELNNKQMERAVQLYSALKLDDYEDSAVFYDTICDDYRAGTLTLNALLDEDGYYHDVLWYLDNWDGAHIEGLIIMSDGAIHLYGDDEYHRLTDKESAT